MRNALLTLLVLAISLGASAALTGCGPEGSQLDSPTSAELGSRSPETTNLLPETNSTGETTQAELGSGLGNHTDVSGFRDPLDGSVYELIDVQHDGWDVTAEVLTSHGFRQVHYEVRIDGDRCSYVGEVRGDDQLLWRQQIEATWDRKWIHVEETDGVDVLRFDVVQGSREDYTFVSGGGSVTHFSTPVGSDDFEGWRAFWPETGLDWNVDGHLCNGLSSGQILGDEMKAALRSADGVGDPQFMHPLLEQICNILRVCTTMKCRAGGPANELCLECASGAMLCTILEWLGY